MVCQMAKQLPLGERHKSYALCDSWFTCKKVIDAHACRHDELIGALKSKLAFGKYQVRSLESIEKYFALNALAYIFFMLAENGFVKFCDGHKSVQSQFEKQIYFWIYQQAQNNLPFSDVLATLHVA